MCTVVGMRQMLGETAQGLLERADVEGQPHLPHLGVYRQEQEMCSHRSLCWNFTVLEMQFRASTWQVRGPEFNPNPSKK